MKIVKPESKPRPARTQQFYDDAGYRAYRLGKTSFDSGLAPGTKENKWWTVGYARAKSSKVPRFDDIKRCHSSREAKVGKR